MNDVTRNKLKRALYAEAYGAGDIRVGLIEGRYPPSGLLAISAELSASPAHP